MYQRAPHTLGKVHKDSRWSCGNCWSWRNYSTSDAGAACNAGGGAAKLERRNLCSTTDAVDKYDVRYTHAGGRLEHDLRHALFKEAA